jgi:hypothetical protein
MSTKFLSPGWRMPRNANQSRSTNYSLQCNTGDKIEFPTASSILTGTNPYTVSFWYKWSSVLPGPLFYRGTWSSPGLAGNTLSITTQGSVYNNYLRVYHHGGGNDYNITLSNMTNSVPDNQNKWLNVILANDGNGVERAYFNGVLSDITTLLAPVDLGNTYFHLNANQLGGAGNACAYSDLVIFDYKLSDGGVSANETAKGDIALLYGDGTSVSNPMALPSPPIAYYPLGTSAWNGEYLAENNAIGDYVFDFVPGDYIDASTLSVTGDWSVSLWVNSNSTSYQSPIQLSSQQNDSTIFLYEHPGGASAKWGFYDGLTVLTGLTALNTGQWYHLVVTKSGTTYTLFLNGTQENQGTKANINIEDFLIGRRSYNNFYMDGKISNVQVFNSVLSGPEATTLYNYGSPIQTLANIPQSSNLKAWYKLDATEIYNSTSTEWSVDNNQNPSAYPSSLDFDSDFIEVNQGSGVTLADSWSVSIWINTTTTLNNKGILSNGDSSSYDFFTFGPRTKNGGLETYLGSSYVSITPVINDGNWHHLTFAYDHSSTTIKVYTDNSESYSSTSYDNGTSRVLRYLGRAYAGWYWDGKLSNCSIWNDALTPAQVAEIYNNGTPSNLSSHSATSNLVSWWKLNNTTTGVEDSKGSNNGTNNGATEYPGFVNTLAGDSTGMSQSNLVQSDLQTVAPYSKYALNFNGTGDYIDLNSDITLTGNKSVSFWVNFTSTISGVVFGGASNNYYPYIDATNINIRAGGTLSDISSFAHGGLTSGVWYNICITGDGTNATAYLNGSSLGTQTDRGFTFKLINGEHTGLYGVDGKLSNCAIWNTVLTSSQVREIYNEGLPSNLNTFSGTAPVAWWQLGENSSFNGNDWIVADEIGSNNGESDGMGVDALTNGVGTTANGSSTGMSEGSLVGNAPYSVASTVSSNVAVQEFDPLAPSTVISGRSEDVPS